MILRDRFIDKMHLMGQNPHLRWCTCSMYQTTHTFTTSHQVKDLFPFLTERTKKNQQIFTGVQGKTGKVDRQEIYCKLLNIKKPWPTQEASNFKIFGGLQSTNMKYYMCFYCSYILPQKCACRHCLKENTSVDQFWGWPSLAGLMFSRQNRLKKCSSTHSIGCFQAHKAFIPVVALHVQAQASGRRCRNTFPSSPPIAKLNNCFKRCDPAKKKKRKRNKNQSQLSQEPKHLQLRFCTRRSQLEASTKQGFKGESTKQIARVQEKAPASLGWV